MQQPSGKITIIKIIVAIQEISQYNVWWNCLKFSNKMSLSIRMLTSNSSKNRHAICLKFGDLFFNSLTKLELEVKTSISSKIKETLLRYRRKLLVFVIAVII